MGAYVVKGEKNETRTLMDAVVYDIRSRALLFRASGESGIIGVRVASPRRARPGGGGIATALAVLLTGPGIQRYRGISGVASAVFVALALAIAGTTGRRAARAAALLALGLFAAKVVLEARTGHALFAGPLPEGVRVLPSVHLVGGAAGASAFLARRLWSRPMRETFG